MSTEAPDVRERDDCPSADACDARCDQHEILAPCGCAVGGLHRYVCASVGHVDPIRARICDHAACCNYRLCAHPVCCGFPITSPG